MRFGTLTWRGTSHGRSRGLLAAGLLLATAQANADIRVVSQGKATQLTTDEFVVHTDSIGRDFLIEVTRPASSFRSTKMPVAYVTDGGFGIAGPMIRMLGEAGRIPPTFVVSIGYPNDAGRYIGPRQTDLVHLKSTIQGREVGGGGAAFEEFVMKDVRPFIEARYPVDPAKSVLVGHSAGGAFTANVMLHQPEGFAGYVIGGLPVSMDPTFLERAKATASRGANRRVFIGYATSDVTRLRADELAAPLSAPGSAFKVKQVAFPEDDHNTSYLQLIARGIPYVLPMDGSDRTTIQVDPAVLERYVGTYRADAQRTITITRDGSHLFGAVSGGAPVEIFPESETVFFARAANAQATFNVEKGKAVSVLVSMNNHEALALRIE